MMKVLNIYLIMTMQFVYIIYNNTGILYIIIEYLIETFRWDIHWGLGWDVGYKKSKKYIKLKFKNS